MTDYTAECANCGKAFTSAQPARTCSASCRNYASRISRIALRRDLRNDARSATVIVGGGRADHVAIMRRLAEMPVS